jgi:lipopolysaccharide transport system permease protein
VSPVGFTLADAPHGLRWLVVANPLTGLLEAVRWSTIGTPFPPANILAYSLIGTFTIFVFGILVFSRLERQFADVI